MKKTILMLGFAGLLFSCNNNSNAAVEFKTAYVDSSKLMKEYEEVKDVESKYKIQSEEKGKSLEADIAKFQQEVQSFQANARQKGQAWAEQKAAELQKKEQQLQYQQQAMVQSLQMESGQEIDSVVKKVKEYIAEYAKKNNLDYVFNTEEASTVIYGKEQYDITESILKELNAKYKGTSAATKIDEPATPAMEKKEETK
ncbi:OmpH family outer membrane protein [Myroides phaeus]|uniref:OmpH family outer membrane protein n=1 Tax=Myroides phaeus TaxID=702745 RepID=UPI002DBD15DE|nr:OmpH family outer membrane protein [Myroides phaeus]MEC4115836.1 OmpH family outer membrane protein [Myroides phaeus]